MNSRGKESELWQAPQSQLARPPIKFIRLGCPVHFESGLAPIHPTCFDWYTVNSPEPLKQIHCIFCPAVGNPSDSDVLFSNYIATQDYVYFHPTCTWVWHRMTTNGKQAYISKDHDKHHEAKYPDPQNYQIDLSNRYSPAILHWSDSDILFSKYIVTWNLVYLYTWLVYGFCIGWQPMANRNIFLKIYQSYDILRNK